MICISTEEGESYMGILKPFTVSSAFLLIIGDGLNSHDLFNGSSGTNFTQLATKTDSTICKPKVDFFDSHAINESPSMPSSSRKDATVGDGKGRKKKKDLYLLQDVSWNAFFKVAYQQFQVDLEDVYFSEGYKRSKKLKFLKCWIKQVRKSSHYALTMPDRFKPIEDSPKAVNDGLTELPEESEQLFPSSASVGEDASAGASRIQDEVALDFRSDTAESFFSSLHNKIEQGIESGWVDLGNMAKRLVDSSIYWLYQKREVETNLESPAQKADAVCDNMVSVELAKVLLRDPKDLTAKHKNDDASHQASEARRASGFSKEYVIREYELQIFFRMEILQSEIGATIMESSKQKFVRQICLYLETIQCHMEGGFFGEWSLDNYVGKIIKSRYCDSLGDVVDRIYKKMDLLLFVEQDEFLDPLLNSEDSSQSRKEKIEKNELGDDHGIKHSISVEDEFQIPLENDHGSPKYKNREEHARKLIEAQERRERARRFASFTSWVPDLQRVWAPKQPSSLKSNSDPIRKLLKMKKQGRESCDRVCETPMTGNKRSCHRRSSSDEKALRDYKSGSVSKALFQDDC